MSKTLPQLNGHSGRAGPLPQLMGRLGVVLVGEFAAMVSYYLLFSSLPLLAKTSGASDLGAGLVTSVLMAATVLVELCVPALARRFQYRTLFAIGLFVLSAPSLVLFGRPAFGLILIVCALRGAGLALVLVSSSALLAAIIPLEQRGKALGLFGLVSCLPSLVALPAGLFLATHGGTTIVLITSAVVGSCAALAVARLPVHRADGRAPAGIIRTFMTRGFFGPFAAMLVTAASAGVVSTFLPMIASGAPKDLLVAALFAHTAGMTLSRWTVGQTGQKLGQTRLLIGGVAAVIVGLAALLLAGQGVGIVLAMALCGAGFGAVQNTSLVVLFARAPAGGDGAVSAIWNVAYDAGLGLGAFGFGLASDTIGCPAGLVLTILLTCTLVFTRSRRAAPVTGSSGVLATA
jgi:predicted MFS family arabinose efflux permease